MFSHTQEVEFDSQHAPSNTTSGRQIVGSDWSSAVNGRLTPVFVRLISCQAAPDPYSPSSLAGRQWKDLGSSSTAAICWFPGPL